MVFWAPDRKSSVWYCEMAAKSEKVGLWKEKVEREREKKREKRKVLPGEVNLFKPLCNNTCCKCFINQIIMI